MTNEGVLQHVRVLELDGGVATSYAGRMLVDLGATVRKVESGDSLRGRGEHRGDTDPRVTPGALYQALNWGKQPTEPGLEASDLVADIDILLAGRASLSDETVASLRANNPRLVVGLASTCGEMGGDDRWMHLHAAALSGTSNIVGRPDRHPLPPPYEVGTYVAGVNLAAAVLAGHHSCARGGPAPTVVVDVAGTLFSYMWTAQQLSRMSGNAFVRSGRRFPGSGGAYPFALFPCADGYVALIGRSDRDWRALCAMMGDPPWTRQERFRDPRQIARTCADEADELLTAWLGAHTRAELFELAQGVGFPLAPVNRLSEVLEMEQFRTRGSFGAPLSVLGRSVDLLRHPFHVQRPEEESTRLDRRRQPATVTPSPAARGTSIFGGLRVLDLSWVWSGPMVGAALADLGADVIKLENPARLDNARLRGRPIVDGKPLSGPVEELSAYFHQNNRGKRSLFLDIKDPVGVDVFRRLVAESDVVIENLTPGVFERAGIGYTDVSPSNPGLVWLAASSVGATGPLVGLRAYAPIMSALAGLESLVGYDDDPVIGMLGCGLGDANAGSHALLAVLAALVSRQRDGIGAYIDMSQIEAAVSVLVEPLVQTQLNGLDDPGPSGTWHPDAAPHGHYPCDGEDVWVAITVTTDDQWRGLAMAIGGADLAGDAAYSSATGRMTRAEELDRLVAGWTITRSRETVLTALATRGVPAVPVLAVADAESYFAAFLRDVPHPLTGVETLAVVPWSFSEAEARIRTTAPMVGEHTDEILRDVLGMVEAERRDYRQGFSQTPLT